MVTILYLGIGSDVAQLFEFQVTNEVTIFLLHPHNSTTALVPSCPVENPLVLGVCVDELRVHQLVSGVSVF